MGKLRLTRLTTARTWGKPLPSPLYTTCLSKWHFVPRLPNGSPEIAKVKTPATLGPITLCEDLRLKWGLKQSCSLRQELSEGMLHITYMQGNRVDSRFLVIGNQIANLTPDPFFGHNLCFRCPNRSSEPILDIWVPRYFQWYKELLNPLSFDPCNRSINIWKSTGTPTPKMETPLGVWRFIPSHFFTLARACNVTLGLPS
jgi:hypothetical protein